MGSSGWVSVRLLLALAAVSLWRPASARYHSSTSQRRTADCHVQNRCTWKPNRKQATEVICDCSKSQMVLKSEMFPDTVQNITIVRAENISIQENAFSQLRDLEGLSIKSIGNLKIETHGLQLKEENNFRGLQIIEAASVTVSGSAFAGWWRGGTQILMRGISELHVERNAFVYYSSAQGVDVSLREIDVLTLAPEAIVAPIHRLSMWYVHMIECGRNSLGGSTAHLRLERTNVYTAQTRCVNPVGDSMESLSIKFCHFTTVKQRAFFGKINTVSIDRTNISKTIERNGFQLQVNHLNVTETRIGTLGSNGLNVSAKGGILFKEVHVQSLEQHALFSLKVDHSHEAKLRVESLYVWERAADSSLAFSDCSPVHIESLHVKRRLLKVCPTWRWTQQLVGAAEDSPTASQYQVYKQLVLNTPCTDDSYTPLTEASVRRQPQCSEDSGGPSGDRQASRPGPGHTAVTTGRPATDLDEESPNGEDGAHGFSTVPQEQADGPGQPDGGGARAVGRPTLLLGLGLGTALALVAAGCLLLLCCRRRASRLTCWPADTAQTACSRKKCRGDQEGRGAADCRQALAPPDHSERMATRVFEICDYAEPLSMARIDGDYAEPLSMTRMEGDYAEPILMAPMEGDYAEPLSTARKEGDYAEPLLTARIDGDYAEPLSMAPAEGDSLMGPGSTGYADPIILTGGSVTKNGDYAEILSSGDASGSSPVSHAALDSSGRPAVTLAAAAAPARGARQPAADRERAQDATGASLADQEGSESEAPPLPPVTADRLQMMDGMSENALYVPAQDLTRMCAWKRA